MAPRCDARRGCRAALSKAKEAKQARKAEKRKQAEKQRVAEVERKLIVCAYERGEEKFRKVRRPAVRACMLDAAS